MSGMRPGEERSAGDEAPWVDAEPEPEWADEIRRGRRERGHRLREIFAAFGEARSDATEPNRMPGEGDPP